MVVYLNERQKNILVSEGRVEISGSALSVLILPAANSIVTLRGAFMSLHITLQRTPSVGPLRFVAVPLVGCGHDGLDLLEHRIQHIHVGMLHHDKNGINIVSGEGSAYIVLLHELPALAAIVFDTPSNYVELDSGETRNDVDRHAIDNDERSLHQCELITLLVNSAQLVMREHFRDVEHGVNGG